MLLIIPPLLFSLTLHEFAHALAAHLLGDNTAKDQGRLSLNPIRHLDFLGTLLILLSFMIGWAKPVPVNPQNFKNPRRDMSLVAAAGPLANLILVFLSALLLNFVVFTNFFLESVPKPLAEPLSVMLYMSFILNISLCFFNLLPIPPLDGFNIASFFLPDGARWWLLKNQFIFFIAILALIWSGAIRAVLSPVFALFHKTLLPGVM
jgi:Zn-dependent protease